MKHLLDNIGDITESLRAGTILLFDYDGTLVPIAEKPELAVFSSDIRALLQSLATRFKVAIISGRALAEVKSLVGIDGCYYVGNHGFEISGPGVKFARTDAAKMAPKIAQICRMLRRLVGSTNGVIIEDKGMTASIHYRMVKKADVAAVRRALTIAVSSHVEAGEVRITKGKKVLEIRPNIDWDKGKAVSWLIAEVDPERELMPIYFGDDRTDEDAFVALERNGISVLVSEKRRKSRARYFLRNDDEVRIFLERLLGYLDAHLDKSRRGFKWHRPKEH